MRGKARIVISLFLRDRITPAYAGKSQHCERDSGKSEDHPRLCGEKTSAVSTIDTTPGSPPPMRGKASEIQLYNVRKRITPAYAGKRRVCNAGVQL